MDGALVGAGFIVAKKLLWVRKGPPIAVKEIETSPYLGIGEGLRSPFVHR
jgi:hypothetical protein